MDDDILETCLVSALVRVRFSPEDEKRIRDVPDKMPAKYQLRSNYRFTLTTPSQGTIPIEVIKNVFSFNHYTDKDTVDHIVSCVIGYDKPLVEMPTLSVEWMSSEEPELEVIGLYPYDLHLIPEVAAEQELIERSLPAFERVCSPAYDLYRRGGIEEAALALSLGHTDNPELIPLLLWCWCEAVNNATPLPGTITRLETVQTVSSGKMPPMRTDPSWTLSPPRTFFHIVQGNMFSSSWGGLDKHTLLIKQNVKTSGSRLVESFFCAGLVGGVESYIEAVVAGVPLEDIVG